MHVLWAHNNSLSKIKMYINTSTSTLDLNPFILVSDNTNYSYFVFILTTCRYSDFQLVTHGECLRCQGVPWKVHKKKNRNRNRDCSPKSAMVGCLQTLLKWFVPNTPWTYSNLWHANRYTWPARGQSTLKGRGRQQAIHPNWLMNLSLFCHLQPTIYQFVKSAK